MQTLFYVSSLARSVETSAHTKLQDILRTGGRSTGSCNTSSASEDSTSGR